MSSASQSHSNLKEGRLELLRQVRDPRLHRPLQHPSRQTRRGKSSSDGSIRSGVNPSQPIGGRPKCARRIRKKQQGIPPKLAIGASLATFVLAGVLGLFIGEARISRRMLNTQVDASVKLKPTSSRSWKAWTNWPQ